MDINERKLLRQFMDLIMKNFCDPLKYSICGHNIQEFDLPYICRRALVNELELPQILNLQGKKPWQIPGAATRNSPWRYRKSYRQRCPDGYQWSLQIQ